MPIRRISLTDAQRDLSRLVEETFWRGTVHILTRHGEPRAAIVPVALVPEEEGAAEEPAPED